MGAVPAELGHRRALTQTDLRLAKLADNLLNRETPACQLALLQSSPNLTFDLDQYSGAPQCRSWGYAGCLAYAHRVLNCHREREWLPYWALPTLIWGMSVKSGIHLSQFL